MAEYISREDYCEENCGKENCEGYKTCSNCGMLNVPSADVLPVRHGQWIEEDNGFHHCSECNKPSIRDTDSYGCECGEYLTDYCSHCGANMREKEEVNEES